VNDQINGTVDAAPANISQIKEKLVIDYTNTILYQVTWTSLTTGTSLTVNGQVTYVVSTYGSLVALFIQTLFHVKKMIDVTPAPTDWSQLPPPTLPLRYFFFGPYWLCLLLFAVLFLGGALWTYRCKKSIRVLAPPGALDADLSDELDEFSREKSRSGSRGKSGGSGRSGRSGKGGKMPSRAQVKSRAEAKAKGKGKAASQRARA
jgi:uncharacterized membrane protein YgcG